MAESGNKRNIPIKLGDFSVIDTEFASIREVRNFNLFFSFELSNIDSNFFFFIKALWQWDEENGGRDEQIPVGFPLGCL